LNKDRECRVELEVVVSETELDIAKGLCTDAERMHLMLQLGGVVLDCLVAQEAENEEAKFKDGFVQLKRD